MSHIDPENPFASPLEQARPAPDAYTDEEAIRRQYLKHEAAVRSMGLMLIAGGAIGALFSGFYAAIGSIGIAGNVPEMPIAVGVLVLGFSLAVLSYCLFQIWTGVQLRRLLPRLRIPAIILSAISIPFWTIIAGYFLYLVASAKGEYVLSEDYADVRRATPHIKYKTPLLVWILAGLLVVLLTIGCFSAIFG